MKKKSFLTLLLALTVVMSGCGSAVEPEEKPEKTITVSSPSVSEVLQERTSEEVTEEEEKEEEEKDLSTVSEEAEENEEVMEEVTGTTQLNPPAPAPDPEAEQEIVLSTIEGVDIDLTSLSSTVVYAQVYQMMYYPENFVGKTIRMEGIYSYYMDMASGKSYYGCIIQDATACCAQGVEFEPLDSYSYPEDYPEDGDIVVVEGVFDTYEEDGYTYCTLRDAKFI